MAQIFEVSPNALNVPDIDTDIGLMHTLFTLEDTRGLKIGKLDGELCLRLDKDAGMTYHSMWDMFNTWYQQAEKLELYISDKLTILHGQSDHLSRRFRSLISEMYSR